MRAKLAAFAGVLAIGVSVDAARPRISEDRELTDLDVAAWDCLNKLEGTAKTPDGVERNRMKNRSAIDLTTVRVEALDTQTFLKRIAQFDAQTAGKRRTELAGPQKAQLDALEKQIVSLTGYLNLAYVGPPETTNCASSDFHDWHLEVYEHPSEHAPQVGDATPIVCEITPRTQQAIFRDGVRIQALTAFFRRPDMTDESTGHPAKKIRVTGYLVWDDDHNGKADIGARIESIGANKYHKPWRSTAWEIHPAMKIEALDALSAPVESKVVSPAATVVPVAPTPTVIPTQTATLTQRVTVKIPYGETVLPVGTTLPIVARDATTVTVDYMGQRQVLPLSAVSLR